MNLIRSITERIALQRFKRTVSQDAYYGSPSFFILTAGRSGSTLLRKLLMERSKVHIPPESDDLIPLVLGTWRKSDSPREMKGKFIRTVFSMPAIKFWDINEDELSDSIERTAGLKDVRDYISCLYNLHLEKFNKEATLIGDKTPYLALRTNWLTSAYPLAKYIHLVRDGRDVICSAKQAGLHSFDAMVERWLQVNKAIEALRGEIPIIEIKYENMVVKHRDVMNELEGFLKLDRRTADNRTRYIDLGDTVLDHHKNVFAPVTNTSIGKWKKLLSKQEIKKLESRMRFFLKKYEYEL